MAKLRVTKNDPPASEGKVEVFANSVQKTKASDDMDVRDILSYFAGSGRTSIADREGQSHFTRLKNLVGEKMAQKLTSHAFLFNQRPDTQPLNPEQRVQNFFDRGSNDPEVSNALRNYRGLGYGQVQGFRNSPLAGNRGLLGQSILPASPEVAATEGSAQQKIKLLLKQNVK